MPTIGIPPDPVTTRAVGAALLHQFARDRFNEAGLNEDLLLEAEENLEPHITEMIFSTYNDSTINDNTNNQKCDNNLHQQSNLSDPSFILSSDDSRRNEGPMNSTTRQTNISIDEQFVSIVNSSMAANANGSNLQASDSNSNSETLTFNGNDNTTYHSMNASRFMKANLDRLQSSSVMVGYGRELRQIAEEFARSRQRETVRQQANEVCLKSLNKQSFLELLDELFQGGITREKIAVLFFFCTDVALRAASMAQDLVVKLISWSFSFIIDTVCKKVDELGGWDNVLFKKVPTFLFNCVAVLGICAMLTYLHKNLRSN